MSRSGVLVALAATLVTSAAMVSCSSSNASGPVARPSPLTPGMVKLNLETGVTTQAQVIEAFGPPQHVVNRSGRERWVWDQTSYEFEKQSSYVTLILFGAGGDRVRSSSRSTMLIVDFENEIVADYALSATTF